MLLFCFCYDNRKVPWFEDLRCAGRLKISPTPRQGMAEDFLIQRSEFMCGYEKREVLMNFPSVYILFLGTKKMCKVKPLKLHALRATGIWLII